jgi:hypothetical protein
MPIAAERWEVLISRRSVLGTSHSHRVLGHITINNKGHFHRRAIVYLTFITAYTPLSRDVITINDNQNERARYLKQDATCCSGPGWGRVKQLDT